MRNSPYLVRCHHLPLPVPTFSRNISDLPPTTSSSKKSDCYEVHTSRPVVYTAPPQSAPIPRSDDIPPRRGITRVLFPSPPHPIYALTCRRCKRGWNLRPITTNRWIFSSKLHRKITTGASAAVVAAGIISITTCSRCHLHHCPRSQATELWPVICTSA